MQTKKSLSELVKHNATYSKAFVTRVAYMSEDGPCVACLPFGVGRRMKGATRMNLDTAYCHFRSIGAAAGGGIATFAQSDGRMEAYFFFWNIRRISSSLLERTLPLLPVSPLLLRTDK
jgi:hypothetical protein